MVHPLDSINWQPIADKCRLFSLLSAGSEPTQRLAGKLLKLSVAGPAPQHPRKIPPLGVKPPGTKVFILAPEPRVARPTKFQMRPQTVALTFNWLKKCGLVTGSRQFPPDIFLLASHPNPVHTRSMQEVVRPVPVDPADSTTSGLGAC